MFEKVEKVARMFGTVGVSLQDVRDSLIAEGLSEEQVFHTCIAAGMLYPHVKDALAEEVRALSK